MGEIFDNEKEVPVVGRFYNVNCAVLSKKGKEIFVVIIGRRHKDAQLGVNYEHYHIDGRFENYGMRDKNSGKTNVIVNVDPKSSYADKFLRIEVKKRKCLRSTTGILPPEKPTLVQAQLTNKYFNWYASMVGKSCKGKKCPHLGVTMLEVNGILECPLHKLQGNKETELITPYTN